MSLGEFYAVLKFDIIFYLGLIFQINYFFFNINDLKTTVWKKTYSFDFILSANFEEKKYLCKLIFKR